MMRKYPLISQRKNVISSAFEAVSTDEAAISMIDNELHSNVTLKWIKAQLIDIFVFCGAFEAINDMQVIMIARHIREKYYYLTPTELTYFFEQFASGAYGMLFVGKTINPQIILQAMRQCENTLINQRAEIQAHKEEEERKQEELRLMREGKLGIKGWAIYCQKKGINNQTLPMQDFLKEMQKKKFNVK